MNVEEARAKMVKYALEAQGHLELALGLPKGNVQRKKCRQLACQALREISDDDDLIDAMCEADMKEIARIERSLT